jgi:tetratricopeptide (TPR) repeat protein
MDLQQTSTTEQTTAAEQQHESTFDNLEQRLENIESKFKFTLCKGEKDPKILIQIYELKNEAIINKYEGHPDYSQDVANFYRFVCQDRNRARVYRCYQTSLAGNCYYKSASRVYIGSYLMEEQKYDEALESFMKAINYDNNASAHNHMANYYYYVKFNSMKNVDENDQESMLIKRTHFYTAKYHYTKSAEGGNKFAMKNLGYLYSYNMNMFNEAEMLTEKPVLQAFKWLVNAYVAGFQTMIDSIIKLVEYNYARIITNIEEYFETGNTSAKRKLMQKLISKSDTGSYHSDDNHVMRVFGIIALANTKRADENTICNILRDMLEYCEESYIKAIEKIHLPNTPKRKFIYSLHEYKRLNSNQTRNLTVIEELKHTIVECITHLQEDDIVMISRCFCALSNTHHMFSLAEIYILLTKYPEFVNNKTIQLYINTYCKNEKVFIGNRIKNFSKTIDCPVCLDDNVKGIVLDCFEHYVCLDCYPGIIKTGICPCCRVICRKNVTYSDDPNSVPTYSFEESDFDYDSF